MYQDLLRFQDHPRSSKIIKDLIRFQDIDPTSDIDRQDLFRTRPFHSFKVIDFQHVDIYQHILFRKGVGIVL